MSRDSGGGEAEGKKRAHQRARCGACLVLGLERGERGDLGLENVQLIFRVEELSFRVAVLGFRFQELGIELAGRVEELGSF
jgi:hypothetical protein